MKIITAAIALAFALPAAAQTAPAGPHPDHHQQQGADHGQHAQGQPASDQGQHQGHAMSHDDCADRDGACPHGQPGPARQPANPQPHRGH